MAIENLCKSGLMGKSPIHGGFRLTRGYINKLYHVISISTLPPATASVTAFADGQIDLRLLCHPLADIAVIVLLGFLMVTVFSCKFWTGSFGAASIG